ncbi:zinc-binding protein [Frateuria sp. Soil773]|uniref:putative zinc-binding protein n=1 Tax=Frateuria sp. Soil773 TaxID=1736407 RepID=UPI0006FF3078|nr:putative zinc-binding protein [Frateuria sp. Soil773]KRE89079.1 zinc-binding protein [Frateuria sp. Soil773]
MNAKLPLVYACSGCSSAAQMANHLALKLDRAGIAEMSCIAGVGGGVASLVRSARSGRRILALDGCALKCVAACLANVGVVADTHLVLSGHGVKKRRHADFDPVLARRVYLAAALPAAHALKPDAVRTDGERADASAAA